MGQVRFTTRMMTDSDSFCENWTVGGVIKWRHDIIGSEDLKFTVVYKLGSWRKAYYLLDINFKGSEFTNDSDYVNS